MHVSHYSTLEFCFTQPFTHSKCCLPSLFYSVQPQAINNDRSLILKDRILATVQEIASFLAQLMPIRKHFNMKSTLFWACASLLIPFSSAVWQNFENIKSKTPVKEQELAVRGLISRLLSNRASEFTVVVDPTLAKHGQDAFTLQTVAKKLVLTGTTGVAAAWAFYHFLKYDCKAHISWSGNQLETIPKPLPVITQIEKVVVPHRYVCWTCSI